MVLVSIARKSCGCLDQNICREVKEKLEQRLAGIAPNLEKNTQTKLGKKFEALADMADDDAALAEMQDLGLL